MKQRIRLTESDLHRIVKNSVKRILEKRQRLTEDIYVGNSGGYYGYGSIFKVEMDENGTPANYVFSPQGWDFETTSQLEAAAICASANASFLKEIKNSELTQLPVALVTDEDISNALFWLTGGNRAWDYGYWSEHGVSWSEAEPLLLEDDDLMELLNDAISASNNFYELVVNLKNDDFIAVAADIIPTNDEEDY